MKTTNARKTEAISSIDECHPIIDVYRVKIADDDNVLVCDGIQLTGRSGNYV